MRNTGSSTFQCRALSLSHPLFCSLTSTAGAWMSHLRLVEMASAPPSSYTPQTWMSSSASSSSHSYADKYKHNYIHNYIHNYKHVKGWDLTQVHNKIWEWG